ncbi:hypothetical protein L873DRAFT_1788134 [Choiromyces venosus 120613-1]|uniref:Uncharacterized protein n=1 Tax=Choiromyces venosus 120613-1 TaxID=1336337 RepID=A0A3N4JY92_9PEZI|nr:hypothetical protein L873DRAFT_1788134 [Choiromyces venosus 120613-1]
MHSQLLLTLLFTLLALAIAFPSSSSSTTTTETLDNLPLPAVPYLIDDTSSSASFPTLTTTPFTEGSGNEVTPGLFTSGNITGMDDFDGWYKCETSWGSPRVDDIDGTANKLNALGYQHCRQTNRGGSMCTKMVHFWS